MDHSIDARNFDAFVFHGGGCVNFMKVVEKHLMRINGKPEHWIERFEQQRSFMAEMGSLCTASLYVNLLSLLRHNSSSSQSARELNNICLFGYGSCSAATLMQATIHHHRSHEIDLGIMIQEREMVSFNTVRRVVKSHETRERATILPKQKGFYYRDVSYHDSNMHMYVIQSKNESFFEQKSSPIEDLNGMNESRSRLQTLASKVGRSRKAQSALVLAIGWLFWVASCVSFTDNSGKAFLYGFVIFLMTGSIHMGIKYWFKRSAGYTFLLTRYLVACLTFIGYIGMLFLESTYIQFWKSIFLGWYTYDSLFFVISWDQLPPLFRTFISIHHTFAFFTFGSLFIVASDGTWDRATITAIIIWITSDMCHHLLVSYRLSTQLGWLKRISSQQSLKLLKAAFVVERTQRIVAYTYAIIFTGKEFRSLLWLMIVLGIIIDVFDSYYQILGMRALRNDLAVLQSEDEDDDDDELDVEAHPLSVTKKPSVKIYSSIVY